MNPGTAIACLLLLLPAVPSTGQERPLPALEEVASLLQQDRPADAERELRRFLARSEDAAARDLLGIALSRLGRLAEAEEQLFRASELAPEALPPRLHLGRLQLQQGRGEDALSTLRAAARIGPLERDLALWLAERELSLGEEERAEAQLRSVVERFQSVHALLELARLEGRRGESQAGVELVRRALEIAPNSEEVLVAHARISLAVQAPVLAIRALEALTRMHPTVSEHSYLLGVARLQIDDMSGAIDALERSLEIEPRRPLALLAIGTTMLAQKRFEEAREVLRRGLVLDPGNADALAALAEAEEGLGEVENAEEHADQALARQPEQARALEAIGRIRMAEARYEEARDLFLRATTSEPTQPRAHYQLSLAYARLGDREASSRSLELYRRLRKERDERLVELRTQAGLGNPGM